MPLLRRSRQHTRAAPAPSLTIAHPDCSFAAVQSESPLSTHAASAGTAKHNAARIAARVTAGEVMKVLGMRCMDVRGGWRKYVTRAPPTPHLSRRRHARRMDITQSPFPDSRAGGTRRAVPDGLAGGTPTASVPAG